MRSVPAFNVVDDAARLRVVQGLAGPGRPAVMIAASGMCSGRCVVNYLMAMPGDPRHDVLFCGYEAAGTARHRTE